MLALVLGSGRLAVHVAAALLEEGRAFRVLHVEGSPPDAEAAPMVPREEFRIENLGRVIADLVRDGVTDVAFAGTIGRPDLDPSKVDPQTTPLIPAMMGALQSGDDAALRAVTVFFEDAGLTVRGADELAPDLLPKAGVLTEVSPTDRDRSDVVRAAAIVDALGAVDVGQGAVVSSGLDREGKAR